MGILNRLFKKNTNDNQTIADESIRVASQCQGIVSVMLERAYQINYKGYDYDNDYTYLDNELVLAARCYLEVALGLEDGLDPARVLAMWPWDYDSFKPSDQEIDNLIKAAALICADLNVRIQDAKEDGSNKLGDTRIYRTSRRILQRLN